MPAGTVLSPPSGFLGLRGSRLHGVLQGSRCCFGSCEQARGLGCRALGGLLLGLVLR